MNDKIEILNKQDIFSLSLSNRSDLPLFHKNYYDNYVLIKILKENSKITSDIIIRKDKYLIDELTIKKIEDYTNQNLNKLLQIYNNQTRDPLLRKDGGSSKINIQIKSIAFSIDTANIIVEKDIDVFNKFYSNIIDLIKENGTIESSNK